MALSNLTPFRFSEIFLKGKNRSYFEKKLIFNIRESLSKFNLNVEKIPGRYVVSNYDVDDEFEIIEIIPVSKSTVEIIENKTINPPIVKTEEIAFLIASFNFSTFLKQIISSIPLVP